MDVVSKSKETAALVKWKSRAELHRIITTALKYLHGCRIQVEKTTAQVKWKSMAAAELHRIITHCSEKIDMSKITRKKVDKRFAYVSDFEVDGPYAQKCLTGVIYCSVLVKKCPGACSTHWRYIGWVQILRNE